MTVTLTKAERFAENVKRKYTMKEDSSPGIILKPREELADQVKIALMSSKRQSQVVRRRQQAVADPSGPCHPLQITKTQIA
jgi:hypothetical protein